MAKLKVPSPPCPSVSSVSFSIAGLEVVFKEAVLGGFELEVLFAGPEVVDAGAALDTALVSVLFPTVPERAARVALW